MTQSSARGRAAFLGFLVIAGFFLVTEHRAHLFGWLPFLLLLACPLLHLFGHGGHQGGHSSGQRNDDEPQRPNHAEHDLGKGGA